MRQFVITVLVLLQASVLLPQSTCVVFLTSQESLSPQPSAFTPDLSPGKLSLLKFQGLVIHFHILIRSESSRKFRRKKEILVCSCSSPVHLMTMIPFPLKLVSFWQKVKKKKKIKLSSKRSQLCGGIFSSGSQEIFSLLSLFMSTIVTLAANFELVTRFLFLVCKVPRIFLNLKVL